MQYSTIIRYEDVAEFKKHTREIGDGVFIAALPSQGESICFELKGGFLIVQYEENEDGRITYGRVAYKFKQVSALVAIACHVYRRRMFKMGTEIYDISVVMNAPTSPFVVENVGNKRTYHELDGVIFRKDNDLYTAVKDNLPDVLKTIKEAMKVINLIDREYFVRFEVNGKFHYQSLSLVYINQSVRECYISTSSVNYDWHGKEIELANIVKEN